MGLRNQNYLLEIKSKSGKMTEDERLFFEEWRGQRAVVYSIDDALKVVGLL